MFHVISPNTHNYYYRPQSGYLRQLRSAQNVEREEEGLLRRLEEIQLQKHRDHFVSRRPAPDSYNPFSPYPSRSFEDEEFEFATRHRQEQLELEYLRQKAEQDARFITLKRREEELKLKQLAMLREEEEAHLHTLRLKAKRLEGQNTTCSPKSVDYPYLLRQTMASRSDHKSVNVETPITTLRSRGPEGRMLEYLLSKSSRRAQEQTPIRTSVQERNVLPPPKSEDTVPSTQTLEDIFRVLFNSKPTTSENDEGGPSSPKTQTKAEETEKPVLSLKEQLESRLNNDQSVEIRDTIQALLASLSDSPGHTAPVTTPNKGKAKISLAESSASSIVNARDALDSIRSIESSFTALQDDFEFPSAVDFSPVPSRSPSPARSDFASNISEADAVDTRKLAFTARNHPVRSYEQALTRLLAQLDEIESHGNPEVRAQRKAAVALVEGAIDELEKKVESRWKSTHRVNRNEVSQDETDHVASLDRAEPIVPATDEVSALTHEVAADKISSVLSPAGSSEAAVSSDQTLSYETIVPHQRNDSIAPLESSTSTTDTVESPGTPSNILLGNADRSDKQFTSEFQSEYDVRDASSESHIPSYPPISTISSVSNIRPDVRELTVDDEVGSPTSEVSQRDLSGEVSDVDTFLLPHNGANESDVGPNRGSEEVGSDWSEVEAL
ncbi:hypothetical protein D9757_002182 [Collybiopsis confluens]|uniref:BAG domain-containing protein n=1 Tax=Collybiopsis confluens TaxID=2823264 RepID=A0A8H5MFC7_9AGAR|nr:hypothetical protein D9757_002182 [Collybiopsis confluens]